MAQRFDGFEAESYVESRIDARNSRRKRIDELQAKVADPGAPKCASCQHMGVYSPRKLVSRMSSLSTGKATIS